MSCVFLSEAFSLKHVPQVAITIAADDFHSKAVRVGSASDCVFNFVIKAGPSTVALKLVIGSIEGCVALAADIGPRVLCHGVSSGTRWLGSLIQDDVSLSRIELIELASDDRLFVLVVVTHVCLSFT